MFACAGPLLQPNVSQTRPISRGPGPSALPRGGPPNAHAVSGPSPPKRARKDRGPNWTPQEIAALIAAKRDMYLQELDTVDGRDLMTPETSKWLRVSHAVNSAGFSPIFRDGPACKTKWNQIVPDYKRIADYLSRTGRNVPDYWDMNPAERKAEGLPRVFAQDVYDSIHEWYGNRPMIQPPHVRDLLAPQDANYRAPLSTAQNDYDGESEPETDDPSDFPPDSTHCTEDSTPPRSPRMASSTPSRTAAPCEATVTPRSRLFGGVPAGITPHVISSSETSNSAAQRRLGNTGVRRKNVSGHSIVAEATKATGAVMAQQMQDIAEASRELERSKIEVQLKIFSEQMAYQREKDRRLYENATVANDNARLSILKQGEMVSCLSTLSTVLSNSFKVSTEGGYPSMPQAAPRGYTEGATAFHGVFTETGHHGGIGGLPKGTMGRHSESSDSQRPHAANLSGINCLHSGDFGMPAAILAHGASGRDATGIGQLFGTREGSRGDEQNQAPEGTSTDIEDTINATQVNSTKETTNCML